MINNFDFSQKDIAQLEKHGLNQNLIANQMRLFKNGVEPVKLVEPANVNNGIKSLPPEKIAGLQNSFHNYQGKSLSFIPASGAASRMFKDLYRLHELSSSSETLANTLQESSWSSWCDFFENKNKLAIYQQLRPFLKNDNADYENQNENQQNYLFLKALFQPLIQENAVVDLPKALVPFHLEQENVVTAFEAQLVEACYTQPLEKVALHFTISENKASLFQKMVEEKLKVLEEAYQKKLKIDFSYQKRHTDTLAVDHENKPVRDREGQLILRPGGHGALLDNLNDVDADIVFIKNIDNVSSKRILEENVTYKQALAGLLIEVQDKIFSLLNELEEKGFNEALATEADSIAETYFFRKINFDSAQAIFNFYNRPLRICGMVKNQGEPGGGPYWVQHDNQQPSLQIVESSQIDKKDKNQLAILKKSTHFNPVDLVCGLKNYKGNAFELTHFRNENECFISIKSKNGKEFKALELPGLWNGAMAYWNTIMVEVPVNTFNPVKTVLDLLKPNHQ